MSAGTLLLDRTKHPTQLQTKSDFTRQLRHQEIFRKHRYARTDLNELRTRLHSTVSCTRDYARLTPLRFVEIRFCLSEQRKGDKRSARLLSQYRCYVTYFYIYTAKYSRVQNIPDGIAVDAFRRLWTCPTPGARGNSGGNCYHPSPFLAYSSTLLYSVLQDHSMTTLPIFLRTTVADLDMSPYRLDEMREQYVWCGLETNSALSVLDNGGFQFL